MSNISVAVVSTKPSKCCGTFLSKKNILKYRETNLLKASDSSPFISFRSTKSADSFDSCTELKPKKKISLSQRSLDDMSLLYTSTTPPIKEESRINFDDDGNHTGPSKISSDRSFLTARCAQPRLSQFFHDEQSDKSGSSSSTKSKLQKVLSLPNYCFLCGYGGNADKPLIHPCECLVQVHGNCLLQHIKLHKNLTCAKCDVLYNITFGRMRPFWKWHCPYDRKWRKCTCHVISWIILICCIILLFLAPLFQVIELSEIASIVLSILLLIVICWCIFIIIRTGMRSILLFCQGFCLTNYNVAVGSRLKGSPEDLTTRILYMFTTSKSRPTRSSIVNI